MAFTDNFTGNDGDLLEDRTGWTIVTDGAYRATVYTNALTYRTGGGGSGRSLWTCTDQGSADHYTQVKDPAAVNSEDFTCVRLVDIDNFIAWYKPGGGAAGSRLMKMVANTPTDLVTFQGAANDVIKITCDGNSVEIFKNTVQQGTTQTVTDHNTETSQGVVAVEARGNVLHRDDFEAGPMAGGEFVYAGNVPLVLIPDDPTAILSKSYAGSIPLTALPSYTSIGTMVYAGAVPIAVLPGAPTAPLEKSYTGVVAMVIAPSYVSILNRIYSGDISMAVLPGYSSILDRIYTGAITMPILPGYSSVLDRVYGGDIPVVILPNFPVAILEKSYTGSVGLALTPAATYGLLYEYVYMGDLGLGIVPSYASILDRIYAGDVPVGLIPSSTRILDMIYAGAMTVSILPDFPEAILEKSYAGDVILVALPDAPVAPLSKSYSGTIGFVLLPESAYELYVALGEFVYVGSIPLSALISHSFVMSKAYNGEIGVGAIPASLSSGIRAALDSYPPGKPTKEEEELRLLTKDIETIPIGSKEPIFIEREKDKFRR